jgi:histidyl-tRNA synthetase
MKKAASRNCVAAVIIGDNELASREFGLKILDTGEQLKVKETDLADRLKSLVSENP